MAVKMATLRRDRVSRSWISRKEIPADIRDDYEAIYKRRQEERFRQPADCPEHRARVLFSEWQSEIDSRFAALRAKQRGEGHDLTRREAHALAGEWYRWFISQHEDNPGEPDSWIAAQWALVDELEDAVGGDPHEIEWRTPEVRTAIRPIVADRANTAQFLASKGEVLTPAATGMFLDAVLGKLVTATSLLDRRATGDYSEDQHLKTLPEYRRKAPAAPRSGKTAMQLFEGYIIARQLADGTVRRWRSVFTTLDAYLARRDFDALSDDEAQRWVTSLVNEDRSAGVVQGTYITALKAIGRWAVKQRHIARNPFAECEVPVPKKTRRRDTKAFSTEEIRLILSAASAIRTIRTPGIAARRWVPWICGYTGARAGEIAQLRGQDVIEQDGIKALRITPDAGPMKTRQARTVPIHEHLIEQGFWTYARSKGKGSLFFNSAPATNVTEAGNDITHPKRSQADKVRGRVGAWVRFTIGIKDREVGPTHGWRHAFKQIADRHGISDRVSDAITGHAPPTEGRKYGAPTLEDLAKALEKFPRYKIEG
jgi:integrase